MPYLTAKSRARKPHPADVHAAAQIAQAVSFSVWFRKGPAETFREPAETAETARTIAARLNAEHGRHGRRAMIYAITADGRSWPLPLTESAGH